VDGVYPQTAPACARPPHRSLAACRCPMGIAQRIRYFAAHAATRVANAPAASPGRGARVVFDAGAARGGGSLGYGGLSTPGRTASLRRDTRVRAARRCAAPHQTIPWCHFAARGVPAAGGHPTHEGIAASSAETRGV